MSLRNYILGNNLKTCIKSYSPLLISSRDGHTLRGKPPGVAKTLEQRLHAENIEDPEIAAKVNIGFPKLKPSRSNQLKERLSHLKSQKHNPDLEKLARNGNLLIDLEQVQNDYIKTTGQYDLKVIAEHYGIYRDLFNDAYFVPRVTLDVKYKVGEETFSPVYSGNIVKPSEAASEPEVSFEGTIDPISAQELKGDTYWTLIATNPDGHLSGEHEYVHWFISNIPNGDVKKGDLIVPYLQPFPAKGLGYQRFVFILYKHNAKMDFGDYKVENAVDLDKRTFKTIDFYRKFQDDITPAGLAFFQSHWDKSITNFFHNILGIKEPSFEYDFPAPYHTDQKWFPLKQPFNLYMDKHRDQKLVNLEYLERKLADTHPFDGPKPPLRFPNAHSIKNTPSWLKTEIKKDRLRIGRINDY